MSKNIENLEDPLKIKYWTLQEYLKYCEESKCSNFDLCHSDDGTYFLDVIEKECRHENIKKAYRILGSMLSKHGVTSLMLSMGDEYERVMRVVREKVKEKRIVI